MSNTIVLTSMASLDESFKHIDRLAFPDDTAWFNLFEDYVLKKRESLQLYYSTVSGGDGSMLFPLILRSGKLGVSTLESVQNYYSVDYRPVCSTEKARDLIPEAVTYIIKSSLVDAVILKPMDPDAPETELIKNAFLSKRWLVFHENCQANWIHNANGSYDDYLQNRTKRLRNTINRKTKRLLAMSNVDLTVHDGSANLDKLISAYNAVYEKSWKVDEPHPDFIPALIKAVACRGQLRLGLISIDGIPIAVHFWIVKHRRAYIYKLAHDAAYDRYSPGTVLMAQMIKNAIEKDAVTMLDFLSGDDKYKRDWMDERFFKIKMMAYNSRSIKGLFLCLLEQYVRPLKQKLSRPISKPA